MSIHDGVVTVAHDEIPVIVELRDDLIRLTASGTEIGRWSTDECQIDHVINATYAIRAENETLSFVPNQPGIFAAAVNGGSLNGSAPAPKRNRPVPTTSVHEAPPPKPLTMALFYGLCVVTAGLAIWSLISIIL